MNYAIAIYNTTTKNESQNNKYGKTVGRHRPAWLVRAFNKTYKVLANLTCNMMPLFHKTDFAYAKSVKSNYCNLG